MRQLWAIAAGRCEFRGCNALVFEHHVTSEHANLGYVSHIVAASPEGPRGHPDRSPKLAQDIKNLMLTCTPCASLIDKRTMVRRYPESRLLEFKREHEDRVRMLTSVTGATRTQVLVVKFPLDGGSEVTVGDELFDAILPDFPLGAVPEEINLNDFEGLTNSAAFTIAANALRAKIRRLMRERDSARTQGSVSVFALGPIPLLVFLGSLLGDGIGVRTYQKHRNRNDWTWRPDLVAGQEENFELTEPEGGEDESGVDVALVLDVSARVPLGAVKESLPGVSRIYRVGAASPSLDYLQRRQQVEAFGVQIRDFLGRISAQNPTLKLLHVFAAVPAPIAVELGRNLRMHVAAVQLYEFRKKDRSYWPALKFTPAER